MTAVLVLNATYEPISYARLNRAVALVLAGKAVIDEHVPGKVLRHQNGELPYPRLIRLLQFVKVPIRYGPATWSKAGVLKRDNHKCGYCGRTATTIDHIHPQSRGGKNTWENTIGACLRCNGKKRDRTPKEARMTLQFEPTVPMQASLVIRR
jgi:hypothetical protein